MILDFIRGLGRFLLLGLVQILVLNNINLSSFINPYIYVLSILLFPIGMNGALSLLMAFLIGITMDMFHNSMGIHASASVLLAFARIQFLRITMSPEELENPQEPSLSHKGINWFLIYGSILILLHHTSLFFLEILSFKNFLFTFSKVLISSALTLLLVILGQVLFYRGSSKA